MIIIVFIIYFHISFRRNYALFLFFLFHNRINQSLYKNCIDVINCEEITSEMCKKKPSEIDIHSILKPNRKIINLKLRDEIQNIYLFIDTYLPFLSMKSELKENQS